MGLSSNQATPKLVLNCILYYTQFREEHREQPANGTKLNKQRIHRSALTALVYMQPIHFSIHTHTYLVHRKPTATIITLTMAVLPSNNNNRQGNHKKKRLKQGHSGEGGWAL